MWTAMTRRARLAIAAALLVGLPLLLVIAAFVAGVSIDGSRWRDLASRQASAALGRTVVVQGALRLTLGRELLLRIGELRVASPPGFDAPQLLSVGEARVALALSDLPGLLRGAPRLSRVDADDVMLWLERGADGRGNWSSRHPREPGSAPSDIAIGQITLKRVAVHHHDPRGAVRRQLDLESLFGRTGPDGEVHLSLRGLVEGRPAYRLQIDGGPLRLLRDGAEPWPFKLELRAQGARLQAGGVLDADQGEVRVDFDASADEPARAGRWLGVALPQVGMVALRGGARAGADGIDLTRLRGTLPGADFSGELSLGLAAARPRLTGALHFGTLDLQPWLAALSGANVEQPEHAGRAWQDIALRDLPAIDAELDFSVKQGLGLPIELRDAHLALRADVRGLHAPFGAKLHGANVSGRIDLDTAAATPTLALQLAASGLPLGELAGAWGGEQDVDVTLGGAALQLGGRGETLGAWLQDLDAALVIADLDARVHGEGPVALALDRIELLARRGERVQGNARGAVLGERVAVTLRAGRVSDLLDRRTLPIELQLATAQATLHIATDLAAPQAAQGRTLSFDFQARRSGELARWLGVAPESTLPVAARGRLRLGDDAWQLDAARLQIGRSDLALQAEGSRGTGGRPTKARVRSALIDLPELSTLRAEPKAGRPQRPSDAPAHAGARDFGDADLKLELQLLQLGRTTLSDVGLVAQLRQGQLLPSQLSGRVAGTGLRRHGRFRPARPDAAGPARAVGARSRRRRAAA
jgi:AsmA family protein